MICFISRRRGYIISKKILCDDAAIHECHPCVKVIDDYAVLLAVSVKSMSGNFSNLFEQRNEKHKCSEEEFRYIERLLSDTVKALEHTIDTALYFNRLFNSNEGLPASVKLCKECLNEANSLLTSGYEINITSGANNDGCGLTKLMAKASEIYAASLNKTVRTLIGGASSIEELPRKKYKLSKEALQKMEDLCKSQTDASYSAAEISAYFNNLVRILKNKMCERTIN